MEPIFIIIFFIIVIIIKDFDSLLYISIVLCSKATIYTSIETLINKEDFDTTLFVGNLPFIVNEEELRTYFEPIGGITNIRILRDKETLLGLGVAFIQFDQKPKVKQAIQEFKEKKFKGRILRLKVAIDKTK
jgi:RNA recognition motif-containing protein